MIIIACSLHSVTSMQGESAPGLTVSSDHVSQGERCRSTDAAQRTALHVMILGCSRGERERRVLCSRMIDIVEWCLGSAREGSRR